MTVFSRGTAKKEAALGSLGAHDYIDSTDPAAMAAAANRFDFILDTVSAVHDVNALVSLLNHDGTLCLVGAPPTPHAIGAFPLLFGRRSICGSLIGGIKETQDMLDFCGRENIVCDVEIISADQINEAYERTMKSDVRYRFVIDTATL